jgi:hypothetical protein
VQPPDWQSFDLEHLAEELRDALPAPEREKTIWAFEQVLRVARIDEHLLDHLLVAAVCLLARANDTTPRDVLEDFFRRSVPDEEWRRRYAWLFA